MVHGESPSSFWHGVRRRLSPSYGAQANAAEGLDEARRTHAERAEAARAVYEAGSPDAGRVPLPRDGSGR